MNCDNLTFVNALSSLFLTKKEIQYSCQIRHKNINYLAKFLEAKVIYNILEVCAIYVSDDLC